MKYVYSLVALVACCCCTTAQAETTLQEMQNKFDELNYMFLNPALQENATANDRVAGAKITYAAALKAANERLLDPVTQALFNDALLDYFTALDAQLSAAAAYQDHRTTYYAEAKKAFDKWGSFAQTPGEAGIIGRDLAWVDLVFCQNYGSDALFAAQMANALSQAVESHAQLMLAITGNGTLLPPEMP